MNKFKIGDIVRYSSGPTALMKITYISRNHGGKGIHRYYGIQYYGSSVGAYIFDVKPATKNEVKQFKTDKHLGRLRDYPELIK